MQPTSRATWSFVAVIEPDRIQTRHHDDGAPAWLARVERIPTADRPAR